MFVRVPDGAVGVYHDHGDRYRILDPGRHWIAQVRPGTGFTGPDSTHSPPPGRRYWIVDTRERACTMPAVPIVATGTTFECSVRYRVAEPITCVQVIDNAPDAALGQLVHAVARTMAADPGPAARADLLAEHVRDAGTRWGIVLVGIEA